MGIVIVKLLTTGCEMSDVIMSCDICQMLLCLVIFVWCYYIMCELSGVIMSCDICLVLCHVIFIWFYYIMCEFSGVITSCNIHMIFVWCT